MTIYLDVGGNKDSILAKAIMQVMGLFTVLNRTERIIDNAGNEADIAFVDVSRELVPTLNKTERTIILFFTTDQGGANVGEAVAKRHPERIVVGNIHHPPLIGAILSAICKVEEARKNKAAEANPVPLP